MIKESANYTKIKENVEKDYAVIQYANKIQDFNWLVIEEQYVVQNYKNISYLHKWCQKVIKTWQDMVSYARCYLNTYLIISIKNILKLYTKWEEINTTKDTK